MELTLNIGYDQLLLLVKQLSANQIAKLKSELDDEFVLSKSKAEITEFQKFLLNGPVMNKEQFNNYLENRKHFNKWRTK
jgi:hypothetical protein